jgi:hypothetical protein
MCVRLPLSCVRARVCVCGRGVGAVPSVTSCAISSQATRLTNIAALGVVWHVHRMHACLQPGTPSSARMHNRQYFVQQGVVWMPLLSSVRACVRACVRAACAACLLFSRLCVRLACHATSNACTRRGPALFPRATLQLLQRSEYMRQGLAPCVVTHDDDCVHIHSEGAQLGRRVCARVRCACITSPACSAWALFLSDAA